jgi:hypothetical protein
MMFRGLVPVAALAFVAAHVAAFACRVSMSEPPAAEESSCCGKKAPKEPRPEPKPCCCADGALVAVEAHAPSGLPEVEVEASETPRMPPVRVIPGERAFLPPGRAPDVPLYTLHSTLLI